jgi:hypothetical protein
MEAQMKNGHRRTLLKNTVLVDMDILDGIIWVIWIVMENPCTIGLMDIDGKN